jgi:hypothetical protein
VLIPRIGERRGVRYNEGMEQDSKRGPVREAAGVLRRLGKLVKGRVQEFAEEKHEEAG